jgi:predicted alpha/beta superfamily hydrolase
LAEVQVAIEGFRQDQAGGARASTVTGELLLHQMASAELGNTRTVRVWLPPGYREPGNEAVRYPVLYMHDGQNCFDAATSFAGEWRVDETATDLIQRGVIRPVIVVGIDNVGAARSDEYSPIELGSIRPGTGGKGDAYIRFLETEVMALVNREYRTLTGPENTFMGGSSLGGVITLHAAMSRPGLLGAILVESPSLWVGDGELKKRVLAHKEWPRRVFMAMGDKEYGTAARDGPLVEGAREVERSMREAGLGEDRLRFEIGVGAGHNEAAWAERLPGALGFLLAKE